MHLPCIHAPMHPPTFISRPACTTVQSSTSYASKKWALKVTDR